MEESILSSAQRSRLDSDRSPAASSGSTWTCSLKLQAIPHRYWVVLLLFLAITTCYLDRVNLAIAIIPMAEEFGWNKSQQGTILGAFFFGYIITQMPARYLIQRKGGKFVLSLGVLGFSFSTLLTALIARILPLIFAARVLLGLTEGVVYPAVMILLSEWVPWTERTRAVGLVFSGNAIGTSVSTVVAPLLIEGLGWRSIFYVYSSVGFFWYAAWKFVGKDRPALHPSVSPEEREFIQRNLHSSQEREIVEDANAMELISAPKSDNTTEQDSDPMHRLISVDPGTSIDQPIPWKLLLTTTPCWAIYVAHFCNNWGLYFFINWLPSYFHDVLNVDLAHLGWISVMPWCAMWLLGNVGYIGRKKGLQTVTVRKALQVTGFVTPSILLLLLISFASTSKFVSLCLLVLTVGFGSMGGAFIVSPIDIAPNILFGISNTIGTFPGILGVPMVGFILDATNSWANVFYIQIVIWLFGAVFFCIFAKGHIVIP